jgi:hypothetical protein
VEWVFIFSAAAFSQGAKRVWVRDLWHLRNRLMLMHPIWVLFNLHDHAPPLQLARLVAKNNLHIELLNLWKKT